MNFLKYHPKVRIGDFASVEQKMRNFLNTGPEEFMIVADFDYTLTSSKTDFGDPRDITYEVLARAAAKISPHYRQSFDNLSKKYTPIEIDPSISDMEKSPAMEDWWRSANDLIVSAKFKQTEMLDLVKKSTMRLRSNAISYFDELERMRIPLIILSAGITNIIEASLLFELGRIPKNMHIVSNEMFANEEGIFYKFSEPVIHSYSKNGNLIENCLKTVEGLEKKQRIILLGDSRGDLRMLDGCRLLKGNNATVLKIGFLNGKVDTLLQNFLESFDIVIVEDQTVDILRHLNFILFGIGKPLLNIDNQLSS